MKPLLRTLLPLALVILPLAIQFLYIRRYAVDVPWWDQWDFVQLLRVFSTEDASGHLQALWDQHNEHRILFPRLIFLGLARLTGWNVVAEMYFSLFLSFLALIGLGLIYRKAVRGPLWGFVPLAWLMFSLGQWQCILWGWQLQFYLQVLATVFALYLLSVGTWRTLFCAILCGVVASFSLSAGLLVWPTGALLLALLRAEKRRMALWLVSGISVVSAYFIDYTSPGHHPTLAAGIGAPLSLLDFFLANVGASLGGGILDLSMVMGACLVILVAILLVSRVQRRPRVGISLSPSDAVPISLVVISFLTSAVITLSRVGFHQPELAIASRYVTLTSLGVAGIYMLAARRGRWDEYEADRRSGLLDSRPYAALLAILIVGLSMANMHGLEKGRDLLHGRSELRSTLQSFDTQPRAALKGLYPDPRAVRERAAFLESQGWSVFRVRGDPGPTQSKSSP
jgi:hypothetical protein